MKKYSIKLLENVSKQTDITIDSLKSKRGKANINIVRFMYWKLVRDSTTLTYTQIGELANHNHATVINGINRINGFLDMKDIEIMELYNKLKTLIKLQFRQGN